MGHFGEVSEIANEQALDEILTRPRPVLIEYMSKIRSPLVILGAGGKMGPTLAGLAQRAAQAAGVDLEIVAASRFSNLASRAWLEARGVRTVSVNLFERDAYTALPDSENVLYLAGLKFGTTQNPVLTWATNTLLPALACERYLAARIAAVSSGNVYPLVPAGSEGCRENDPLTPLGEYANSCVARERIFEYFSTRNGTPVVLMRLSYALDLRYGVLLDIAQRVFRSEPVDVTMGVFNCLWQGDANEMLLRALALARSPAYALNLTGPVPLHVRAVALRFAQLMGKKALFLGQEAETALLSSTQRMIQSLGAPPTPPEQVLRWTAGWVMAGGRTYNKPTHFQARDGKY
jgi:nucleoside-diphosphate-sugar epimerase